MFLPFRGNALFVAKATRESSFCGKGFPEKRSLRAHAEKGDGNGDLPDSLKTGELSNKAGAIASRFFFLFPRRDRFNGILRKADEFPQNAVSRPTKLCVLRV